MKKTRRIGKITALLTLLTMICMNVGIYNVSAAESELTKGVSIMCVGESTTYGNKTVSAFRGPLYRLYNAAGINTNFIGPFTDKTEDMPKGSGHAGIGGAPISRIAAEIEAWLDGYAPQVVFLTIGGNDTSNAELRDDAPQKLEALVKQIIAKRPAVELYVASITPANDYRNEFRQAYNNASKPLIEAISAEHTNVHYVDIGASITDMPRDLQEDKLHPTEAGYAKMAQSWYDATAEAIRGIQPTNPPRLIQTAKKGDYMAKLQTLGHNDKGEEGKPSYKSLASKTVTVEPNTDYAAKFYMKGDSGASVLARVYTTVDGAWKQIKSLTCTPGPEWTEYTIEFNSGEYTSVFCGMQDNTPVADKIVYFDDFSVSKVNADGTLGENLLEKYNPYFANKNSNWSLNSSYSIVLSRTVIRVPASAERPLGNVMQSKRFTFDEINASDNQPTDIKCNSVSGSHYFTLPDRETNDYISNSTKPKIFYLDESTGKRGIMLNVNTSYSTSKFSLERGSVSDGTYNDITGFDEMKITMRMIKRTDGSQDYSGKKPQNYPLSVTLSENEKNTASTKVNVIPEAFEEVRAYTIKRSEFAGNTLDMDGELKKHSVNGRNYNMLISFQPKGGICTMIDEIEFVWYEGSGNLEYREMNFLNNGENVNASGLYEGTTSVSAKVYNSMHSDHNGAVYAVVLYDKRTASAVDIDMNIFDLPSKTLKNDLEGSVTVPDGENPQNYEIRVYMWDGTGGLRPITKPLVFDTGGAANQD